MKSMAIYGIKLGVICLVATGLLATVNAVTAPKINLQAQKELEDSLKEVLPQGQKFEPVLKEKEIIYYKAFDKEGNLLGAAFKTKSKGYSGLIETMVGITLDGTIKAIKILSQSETPGLGARITEIKEDNTIFEFMNGKKSKAANKPWFQEQFAGKTIAGLDDVSAITGATISSKAVIDSVKTKTLEIEQILKNEK